MRSPIPFPLFYLFPLAGYWLGLIYYLGAQWSVYEQYTYGWAVPFLCLYLIWQSANRKAQSAEGAGGNAEKLKSGDAEIPVPVSFSAFQLFSVCLLCLLYAP